MHGVVGFPYAGIYLEGGEHRDFPPLRLISLPRISKVYVENSTEILEYACFLPPELIILYESLPYALY